MCWCMHILQIHIYYCRNCRISYCRIIVEIEAKCPGRGHTAGSRQSWDSNAAQTPWQARIGDTVPLAIGSCWFSSKSPASIQGPAEGHRWGLLDTHWEAEDSVVSGWSILFIMVEGLCGKAQRRKQLQCHQSEPGQLPLAGTLLRAEAVEQREPDCWDSPLWFFH